MNFPLTSSIFRLVITLLATRTAVAASNSITLVRARELNDASGATLGSAASATAEVDIDSSGIQNIPSITLQGLEDDQSMVYSKQTLGGNENYWYGEMAGEQSGSATLIQDEEGKVSGSFSDDNYVYQMNTLSDGTVVVDTFSYDEFKDDESDIEGSEDDVGLTLGGGNRRLKNLREGSQNVTGTRELQAVVVDVLVVYTRQAMCGEARKDSNCGSSNKGPIEARIRLAESETNLSYQESGIKTRINVVRMHLDESGFTELNGNFPNILTALEGKEDAHLSYVHDLRDSVRADLVTMIVEAGKYCGYGNVQGPFSVTKRVCSTGYYSFGHEIAHGLGCYHDRRSSSVSHPYAHGYQDRKERFRSVMAYNCPTINCKRVARYSNTNHRYQGIRIGNNRHDCARQIDSYAPTVASWK